MSVYKKRRYNSSLTGGSGDVNPQYFHMSASQSGADTTTTTAFPIPIQRLQNSGRAQVMEILKVFWYIVNNAEVDSSLSAFLTTKSSGTTATNYSNVNMIDGITHQKFLTTSGTFDDYGVQIHDLTDGAGHGLLCATDNIYFQITSASTGATNTVFAKILYRWKDVSVQEYVGIVQSQQ